MSNSKDPFDCSLNHEVANKPYLVNVCDEVIDETFGQVANIFITLTGQRNI